MSLLKKPSEFYAVEPIETPTYAGLPATRECYSDTA